MCSDALFDLLMSSVPPRIGRRIGKMVASSSKTLLDFFQQPAKRLKVTSSSPSSSSSISSVTTASATASSSDLSPAQRRRIEVNKLLAKSKLNLKICSERLSASKGVPSLSLEELLVEETWLGALPKGELHKPYALRLCEFLHSEIACSSPSSEKAVYPPPHLIFNALNSTPFDRVKAVILGQDPYHGPGQAMGLSFSVPHGIKLPSSLANIFKELQQDVGCSVPSHGNLERWAVQGVLLLNAVLTGECFTSPF